MNKQVADYIRNFPDHRSGHNGVRYPFGAILLLVIVGFLSGRNSLRGIYRLSQSLSREEKQIIGFYGGRHTPCLAALCNCFRAVKAEELSIYLGRFFADSEEFEHISIDGKRLRGSRLHDGDGVHVVSAFCNRIKNVVGSVETGSTNEVYAALELLEKLDLKGKIVTGDAMFTHPDICKKIIDKGGDYMLTVKDNRKGLKGYIAQEFATAKKTT
jgi:hypothetical protein